MNWVLVVRMTIRDPANNNFKLNELFEGCSSVGAPEWRR